MKTSLHRILNIKLSIVSFLIFVFFVLFNPNLAYSQIDYNYEHINNSGFRLGLGGGVATLITHFSDNPPLATFIGSLDYDISPYFSIGGEGQAGSLQGIDQRMHLAYYGSTDNYLDGNFNFKVAVGAFYNYETTTMWGDVLKRFYFGAGAGVIKTSIVLTPEPANSSFIYGPAVTSGKYLSIPFNFGTNIDLPGIFPSLIGRDVISINPNFQFSYVNSLYLDGYQSSSRSSLKGFYNLTSVKIRFKF